MPKTFVHLSDIHFGQEKGAEVIINQDVKARLIDDVCDQVKTLPGGRATGIIVSGDIVYAGKAHEYKDAGKWLDDLAVAAGCAITEIQVVPGNHDIDREQISPMTERMLALIAEEGEHQLDDVLGNARDREALYARFESYRPFAQGYGCPLDFDGGNAGARTVELTQHRTLRFIGLNTALVCGSADKKGKLLLGARQRVLPMYPGEELVLVAHHPIEWLRDSEDAGRYIRNRARVLITGHEHNPSMRLEPTPDGKEILVLAAGATVPPHANDQYTYTYNLIEFDWDEGTDGLRVTVHPRAWDDELKAFSVDVSRLGGEHPSVVLGCPHFGKRPLPARPHDTGADELRIEQAFQVESLLSHAEPSGEMQGAAAMSDKYARLRLRFFRDLSPSKRLAILVRLGELPDDWSELLTHAIETRVFESLVARGRMDDLEQALNDIDKT